MPHAEALAPALLERVLSKLGLSEPPSPTLEGLRTLYRAWCRKVPSARLQTGSPEALAPGTPLTLYGNPSSTACPGGAPPRHALLRAAAAGGRWRSARVAAAGAGGQRRGRGEQRRGRSENAVIFPIPRGQDKQDSRALCEKGLSLKTNLVESWVATTQATFGKEWTLLESAEMIAREVTP